MKRLINRGLLLLALIMGMAFSMEAQSTQVVVTLNDGTEQNYAMTEADRMYFEDNTILVIETAEYKGTARISLADIRKITCQEVEGLDETSSLDVAFFPNPVHDKVTFRNVRGKQTVKIYALDGRLIKATQIDDNQTVDVSTLPQGLYLVNVNYNTFKMMKL